MSAPPNHAAEEQDTLIQAYSTLLASAANMLELARREQWAELIEQRTNYVVQVEGLSRLDTLLTLDETHRSRKAQLLESILECDAEIRRRLMERRDELGKLIGVSQRQRNLHRAYAPQQASGGGEFDEGVQRGKRPT
ncbi:flagellar protein FliT [Halomonas sp. Bachu 37]|uniref:flagellar protein FliT n=1 Tax=Halomonas kashgarensis TaxID=3084920 RepID=UPI003217FA3A